jgi:hypothetical protein
MNTSLLMAKSENLKERSLARIISIQFIPAKKGKEKETALIQKETILFYTKPIFKAKKYEFF